jgi:hypothetical protein
LIGKDKKLEKFLLILICIHIAFYTIEGTEIFTTNFRTQIRKLRKNNVEQGLYLVSAIVIFVVSSGLGFKAADFTQSFHELKFFGVIYITSLVIEFICNSLCAMTENGNVPGGLDPKVGDPFLSRQKNKFFFNIAQYLIETSNRVQEIILSYIAIGIVAGYTVAYPFGLLSRSLLNSS